MAIKTTASTLVKTWWLLSLAVFMMPETSCALEEPQGSEGTPVGTEVFARIETVDDPETKAYADANMKVLWDAHDEISLFNKNTYNKRYRFLGSTGDNAGEFEDVNPGAVTTGNDLDVVYAVYPYGSGTSVSNDGVLTVELPAEQAWRADSFGRGANTMVSATTDTQLRFKNLCGYLLLKLCGTGVQITSISLTGNRDEVLAGPADVTAAVGGDPSLSFRSEGTSGTITLRCDPPVSLGAASDEATTFWLAVPPTDFKGGFTVSVTDSYGHVFEQVTSKEADVVRNKTYRMEAFEVPPTYLVTNTYVQKYMEEVSYADMDFSNSVLHGSHFPGGGPGENDIPPTVTISWPDLELEKYETVALDLEDGKGWTRFYELERHSTSLGLTNLVPGCLYTYKVHRNGSENIRYQGRFYTRGALHQIYYTKKVRNARDEGGWKTLDGKTVRYRKLYRGGQLKDYINTSGISEMRAEGIKAELDLRENPSSTSPLGSDIAIFGPGFESGYVDGMLRAKPAGVRECFEFTVNCLRADKPVYFHCSAGRDRTGTLSIILLGLLGVREGDLAKDYELTYFSPEEWSMQKIDGVYVYNHTRDVETYHAAIDYLASFDKTGTSFAAGVEQYLISIGVSQKDIDDFRSIMLE